MKMATVSVIMNCLNGARYVREALDSVFAQTYDQWEIIFLDNASQDESGSIAKSYGERIRYFRNDATVTLGSARNQAFSQAGGDYVAILDVDDVWHPEKLKRQIGLFDDPEVGLTFTNSMFFDQTGDKYDLFGRVSPKRGFVFGSLLAENFISSEAMVFRRSSLDRLSRLFHDDLTMVVDYDLTLRVAYNDKVDFIEECLSKWRMHPESESNRKRSLFPKEKRIMLDRLMEDFPNIESDYKADIELYRSRLAFQMGLQAWTDGQLSKARHLFRQYPGNRRCALAYLATFLLPFPLPEKSLQQVKNMFLSYRKIVAHRT